MSLLKLVKLSGFRSIKEADIELRRLNVLIGANGAGKSNLVAFFKLLNEMMGGRLQQFIATSGRARANLHFGPKVTPQLEAKLEFETDNGMHSYSMRLSHAAGDRLVFTDETLTCPQDGLEKSTRTYLGSGHQESRVGEVAKKDEPAAKDFLHLLSHCRVFHFHDTSATARVRQFCYVGDHRWLMPDAANLAAILYRWREENETVYGRIVRTIHQVAPFFDDFVLEPEGANDRDIILNWRHRGSDAVFGPHQISDGTLRAICLISLLLGPQDELPNLIVIDEPELGLHPYALNVVASLLQAASHHTQLLVSTQSSTFLDSFEPEDIIVVERDGEASKFTRPDKETLTKWLEDYSLGEVWEKNVIGGGPH